MCKKLDQAVVASIMKMIPNGSRLELPSEQLTNYPQVKKALLNAGGKYKKCGFEFTCDAQDILARLSEGEAVNDKKTFQFFPTPKPLAQKLVELADIQESHTCLEPEAGQGAISDLILNKTANCTVVELMPENAKILTNKGYQPIVGDFLSMRPESLGQFDRIVANPPFTKNQDIDHITQMYSMLKPGGKIVSIASRSWIRGQQKKQVSFQNWLEDIGATLTAIPDGAFSESGTAVGAVIVQIHKPKKVA
ncbi:MAG: hypothetical protein GW898_10725 [Thiomicrospira sp.]|nr:hypothetical protein [Thiomicrospira sp.]NCO14831.1 hypothetical protein [Thiomicrospira sp.]OIP95443.1 MAG: hypothetical protein AUK56_05230 [Thiomicrospira sp. CG2_30_44_34]